MTDDFYYLEDFKAGQTFTAGPVPVTAEAIVAFAKLYDPQTFHTEPEKAGSTFFGEHVASGWHTASLTMRLIIESFPKMEGGMIGRSVEKMTWLRPVRPGDTLSLKIEVLEIQPPVKSPTHGNLRLRVTTSNQLDKPVMAMETTILAPARMKRTA